MKERDYKRIKNKIMKIDSTKYWGDDFDVRYYLIYKLRKIVNKNILDLGGGIGIISSEIPKENFRINLDLSFKDLLLCKKNFHDIHNVCASMTNLPFKKKFFDVVICSHLLELAKDFDIKNNNMSENKIKKYPTIEKIFYEIIEVLNNKKNMYLTTPNNMYYQSTKLDYFELKKFLENYFKNYRLFFFNTYPRLNKKNRKMNMANVLPKLLSKILKHEKILNLLLKKDKGTNKMSVSFYVEAIKDE